MRKLAKWAAWIVGAAALFLVGAVYWLFYNGSPAPGGTYRLNLDAIRAEAARAPGSLPARIEVEITSHQAVPAIAMTSGASWRKLDLVRAAYRVRYADRDIMIDTGDEEAAARAFGADRYDRVARAHILQALDDASEILVTHEHDDHLGGALTGPHLSGLVPKLALTREQLASPVAPPWPANIRRPQPLDYTGLRGIAPGLVLIKAPGHTPGSQMIYIRRADGREFLFLGDVASMLDNVTLGRQRSRYVTSVMGRSDRQAVADQLQALAVLHAANPALVLVPGHDGAEIESLIRRGLLVRGFR